MAGNVSEWVQDVYRPMTLMDADDVAPFNGNKFKTIAKNDNTAKLRIDSTGRVKMRDVTDAKARTVVTTKEVM